MKFFNLLMKSLVVVLVVSFLTWIFIFNWSFVFKRRIVGEVATVEKINAGLIVTTTTNNTIPNQAFSFSVAIKDLDTGEIHMASSEDRKWGAVEKGNCVIAAFFPYAPWNLSKGTTDFNARLIQNFQTCETIDRNPSFWAKFKFFFLWV
jgi:hypothetical protein